MKFWIKLEEGIYAEIEAASLAEAKQQHSQIKGDFRSIEGSTDNSSNNKKIYSRLYGQLLKLKHEGFFSEPRALADIRQKLKELAVYYPSTTFPPYLNRLLRDRILRRYKEKTIAGGEVWVYVNY